MDKRILIIKLASAGDVLRTTVLLSGLKKRYPDSRITWLAEGPGAGLLEGNANIDRILVYGSETTKSLQKEKFDIIISLDKAIEGISLAVSIRAKEKYGFGLNEKGQLWPLNKEAEYSYLLGLDDELKFFKNKKTYQELIFETVGLGYKGNPYELTLDKRHIDFADNFFRENKLDKEEIIIGINTGAGKVFANKNLSRKRIVELVELLDREIGAKIILLGGPLEKEINENIEKESGCRVINSGCDNSLKDFAALISNCSVVIAADTLAMHIAIALERPVVAIFGPTCSQEINLYNRGYKIITAAGCAPCYKNRCDKELTCMDRIDLNEIVKAVKELTSVRARI